MELTFPPLAGAGESKQRSAHVLLARLSARQERSRTVRLLRQSGTTGVTCKGGAELRMEYFGNVSTPKHHVYGAFWVQGKHQGSTEYGGNHSDSANIKADALKSEETGEQFNHAGHGALRKS
jgi:hypothetical protein